MRLVKQCSMRDPKKNGIGHDLPSLILTLAAVGLVASLAGCSLLFGRHRTRTNYTARFHEKIVAEAQALGEPVVIRDIQSVRPEDMRRRGAGYYAARCIRRYIQAKLLAKAPPPTTDYRRRSLMRKITSRYSSCTSYCGRVQPGMPYANMASRYYKVCSAAKQSSGEQLLVAGIESILKRIRATTKPLSLYRYHRQISGKIRYGQRKYPSSARVSALARQAAQLEARHRHLIRRAARFMTSSGVRMLQSRSATISAQIRVIRAEADLLRKRIRQVGFRYSSGLRDILRAKRAVIRARQAQLRSLDVTFRRMAQAAHVL